MKLISTLLLYCLGLTSTVLAGDPSPAVAATSAPAVPLAAQLDALVSKAFPPDLPGATVLVVKNGEILLRKGYGMANLELGVPMQPDDVLRLGSVTKQFTAVAILQLVEAGKIKLDDDITTYVPELQTGGHKITLTHLLNHTSGLPSFTDQPEYPTAKYQAMPLSKMLAMIKDKPAHFAPGADWAYCNTGYWLLGAVIEKVSGQSYGDYVNEHIFQPAGMVHSSYDQTARIVAQRVPGYTAGSDRKPANADFINMTVPQAAGALISNVDDLWKWEQALAAGKLVRPDLLALAYATGHTADGRATGYGFGWSVGNFKGHPVVEHGGGIEGFLTYVLRVNDAGVFVAVLCNSDRPKANPSSIAHQLAALVLGNAAPVATVTVPIEQLRQYVGVYRLNSTRKLGFAVEGGQLILKRPRGEPSAPLQALSPTEFIAPENEVHFTFLPPSPDGGRRLLWHPAVGAEVYAPRVNEPLDDPEKPAVDLAPEILERYVGDYEATPDFVFTVKHVGTSLTLQATGQSVTDLIAESPVRFRVKQVSAAFEFKSDAVGHVTGLVLFQNGRELPAKKVR